MRWLQVIGEYNFTIVHRAGRSHGNTDGLSHKHCSQCGRNEQPEALAEVEGTPYTINAGVRAVTSVGEDNGASVGGDKS